MGLFKKKPVMQKKSAKKPKVSSSDFPKYVSDTQQTAGSWEKPRTPLALKKPLPKFPEHEELKIPSLDIPKRTNPSMGHIDLHEEEFHEPLIHSPKPFEYELPKEEPPEVPKPPMHHEIHHEEEFHTRASDFNEPVYVKIESYQKSVQNLKDASALLRQAEKILAEIQRIKTAEDKQLDEWFHEITEIKNKLLTVDKDLFEYR